MTDFGREKGRSVPGSCEGFLRVVKDVSKKGPVRFVICDKSGAEIHVGIENEEVIVNGEHLSDAAALIFISRKRRDFEQLFVAAAKQYLSESSLMGELYLAKLADAAHGAGKKAELTVCGKRRRHLLLISRRNGRPVLELDGTELGEEEGKRYVREHYVDFLAGYKKAVKGLYEGLVIKDGEKKKKEKIRASVGRDGHVKFDINEYLNAYKKKQKMDKLDTRQAQSILKKGRGYVE